MNKKFTKLIAALALLVFMTPTMVGWGQTKDNVQVTVSISDIVSANNYTVSSGNDIGDIVTSIALSDDITMSTSGDPNCGSFWGTSPNIDWRLYESANGDVTITTTNGTLYSVKFTYSPSNNGSLYNGSTAVSSNTTVSLSSENIATKTFTVGHSSGNKKGQVRITSVEVYYTPAAPTTYSVTYNANGGNGEDFIDDNGGEGYASGEEVAVLANEGNNNPNFTKTGHDFFCWSDMEDGGAQGANLYDPDDTFEINGNTTLYAQWSVNKYNVALALVDNVNLYAEYGTNGTLIEGHNEDIDYGTMLTLTADELAQGYGFVWQVTDGDNNDVTEDVLDGNILTVPAYNITISGSIAQTYTVIFDSNGIETIVSQIGNSVFSLTAPTNVPTGFTFVGWTMYETELNVDNLLEGTTVDLSDYNTDNASLYAVFSGEVGAFPAIPATPGSYVKVTETPADGWAGDYLIVYEDFAVEGFEELNVLNSHYGNTNANTYGTYSDLYQYYDNGVIEYNSTTSSYAITVAATTNGYSLYDNGDQAYLGNSSSATGSKLRWDTQFTSNTDEWTLGVNSIVSVYDSDYAIRWNSNDPRFAIYKTNGQKAIQLYKYVEGTPGAPAIAGTTQRFIRVFQNETAEDYVFILGPSIIPSGYYLDMGDYEILSEDADMFIIEDGGQLISDQDEVYATVQKNIRAWTSTSNPDAWYFIASPISSNLTPSNVVNMLTADETVGEETIHTFDLYKFDVNNVVNEEPKPWYNYRAHSNEFVIANGQGYLYANASDQILGFSGEIKPYSTASNSVTLTQAGWNLIGNPFTCAVSVNVAFSELNNGTAVTNKTANSTIMPCAGIAVNGNANDVVTFTMVEPQQSAAPSNPSLQMTLSQQVTNRGNAATLDNAIVSFNEGSELPKFYFMEQNANLYIPQGTEEYAIVSTEAQGEMPVNFRANEDGQYTLTVNPENVEMNYLHLIDNMTGADIDLLQTPSYTFNANVTDYECRFKLVFATNNEDGASASSATFAFYSNGNWIISNIGEATLQVVDVTGRILSSETVNGSVSKTINATPGVYMLRLINGENVKVQKIVVR